MFPQIFQGSEEPGGRITMTKLEGSDTGAPSGQWQDDARLSMGNTTRDGRLDLKYRGVWHAVCTNYNKWVCVMSWVWPVDISSFAYIFDPLSSRVQRLHWQHAAAMDTSAPLESKWHILFLYEVGSTSCLRAHSVALCTILEDSVRFWWH